MSDRAPLDRLLHTFRRWWSADDPRTRAKGIAGKVLVEWGGTALVLTVLFVTVGAVLAILPWTDAPAAGLGTLTTFAVLFSYLERRVWCNVIRPLEDTD